MGFLGAALGGLKGFDQAAGAPDAAQDVAQLQQKRAQQQQDQLKLQIAPLTQAIQADRQKLTAFMDDKGNVIPEHQKDYDATVKNMSDMLGRMRGIMGQRQPSEDPNHFESTIAGLTDKLHITRDLAHQLHTKQQQKRDQWNAQNAQTAQDTAAGTLPYAMTPEGQGEAAKARDAQTLEAQRAKSAADVEAARAKSALDVANVKDADKTKKGPEVEEKGGAIFITDPKDGTKYSASNIGQAPPDVQRLYNDAVSGVTSKEQEEQNKENHRLDVAEKLADYHDQIRQRQQELAESSKIPMAVAGRVTQAQIIKEQVADLRAKLQDPDITRYMGPVVGSTAGKLAELYSKKVKDFYASQESLDALLPLLHGYRGGAQTHEMFKKSMGSLAIDPEAYKGTLDALDKLSDNVTDEVKQEYPNAPMFKGQSKGGGGEVHKPGDFIMQGGHKFKVTSVDQAGKVTGADPV